MKKLDITFSFHHDRAFRLGGYPPSIGIQFTFYGKNGNWIAGARFSLLTLHLLVTLSK